MSVRLKLVLLIPAVLTGCARPKPDPVYQATALQAQTIASAPELQVDIPNEPELSGPHTVDYYIQVALERNPEIQAARGFFAAQREVIPQVKSLDDPMLMETLWPGDDNSPQTASGRLPNSLMLSQKFPWFGKLQLRGEVAFQQAEIALTQLCAAELKITEQVTMAYHEILFHQQAIELSEASEELLFRIRSNADTRYRSTQGSLQDVYRADVELAKLQERIVTLKRGFGLAQADLAELMHTSQQAQPRAVIPKTKPHKLPFVPEDIDALYEVASRHRPELQARYHAIVRDQREQELSRLNYYPDVTVGVGWQAITKSSALSGIATGDDNVGITLGVNLPLWRKKLEAGVREAEFRAIASGQLYEATQDDTLRLIKRLMVQVESLQKQITLFTDPDRGIIRRAADTYRVSRADYTVGKVDFQQLIDNWTDLLEFHIQVARLEATLHQTLASLERVVGCQLATLRELKPEPAEVQ